MAKKIDTKQIEELAFNQCNNTEIASVVGITPVTLTRKYKKHVELGRLRGKAHIKNLQMEKAQKGDVKMMIHLGKNYCGQKDQHQDAQDKQPLPFNFTIKTDPGKKDD